MWHKTSWLYWKLNCVKQPGTSEFKLLYRRRRINRAKKKYSCNNNKSLADTPVERSIVIYFLRSQRFDCACDGKICGRACHRRPAAFLYSHADRKRSLLIGRDLKCVAFADDEDDDPCMWVALSPLRATLSRVATSSRHAAPPSRNGPTWKIPGRHARSRRRTARRAFEIASSYPLSARR